VFVFVVLVPTLCVGMVFGHSAVICHREDREKPGKRQKGEYVRAALLRRFCGAWQLLRSLHKKWINDSLANDGGKRKSHWT